MHTMGFSIMTPMARRRMLLTCLTFGLLMTGLTAPPAADKGGRPPKPPRLSSPTLCGDSD